MRERGKSDDRQLAQESTRNGNLERIHEKTNDMMANSNIVRRGNIDMSIGQKGREWSEKEREVKMGRDSLREEGERSLIYPSSFPLH